MCFSSVALWGYSNISIYRGSPLCYAQGCEPIAIGYRTSSAYIVTLSTTCAPESARVFEAYPMQVLVYSDSTGAKGEELEFRVYTGEKQERVLRSAQVHNGSVLAFEQSISPSKNGFRHLVLKTEDENTPPVFKLFANYPNPFNPSTTFKFSIPSDGKVQLSIYNIKGQKVRDLLKQDMQAGTHTIVWEGKDYNNRPVGSGIYFYKLVHGGKTTIRKMALVK